MNKKRVVRWTAFLLCGVLVTLLLAAIVAVHTTAFQRFVLTQLEQKIQDGTGDRLDIKGLSINWRLLTFDLYGISLREKDGDPQSPLFAADHLRVGLKIVSLLRRKIDLSEMVLDHPTARITVNRNGISNLPKVNASGNSGSAADDILNLAIRHFQLNSGVLYYNDAQIPLAADVQDLRADVHFNPVASEYRGTIGYTDGRIAAESLKTIPHRLQLAFLLDRSGVTAAPLTVATEQSTLNIRAKLTNYEHPTVEWHVRRRDFHC